MKGKIPFFRRTWVWVVIVMFSWGFITSRLIDPADEGQFNFAAVILFLAICLTVLITVQSNKKLRGVQNNGFLTYGGYHYGGLPIVDRQHVEVALMQNILLFTSGELSAELHLSQIQVALATTFDENSGEAGDFLLLNYRNDLGESCTITLKSLPSVSAVHFANSIHRLAGIR